MPFSTSSKNAQNNTVVSIVYENLCTFEFGITHEIFGLKRPEVGADWYRFKSVSLEGDKLAAAGGLTVSANGTLTDLRRANTIIVPGWRGADEAVPKAFTDELIRARKRGARIISICGGAFVLAACGLLDGKRATTHWRLAQQLQARYPDIMLELNQLYTEDDGILTSAGSSAGIDLCLHVVRSDYGASIANSVARRLVMHGHRLGGQAQYIEQPVPKIYEADRLSWVLEHIRSTLGHTHHISELAKKVAMSERTFQRRFRALTGMPLLQWILHERIQRTSQLLETSASSLDEIANTIGLGSEENLRLHFRRQYGISPKAFRDRFSK
jgi:AraC family transcriptional regulator, transcriptional activator FtrA